MASEQTLLHHKVLKIASVADAHSSKVLRAKALDTLITTPTSTTLPKELGGDVWGCSGCWPISSWAGSYRDPGDKRLWKADFFFNFFRAIILGRKGLCQRILDDEAAFEGVVCLLV